MGRGLCVVDRLRRLGDSELGGLGYPELRKPVAMAFKVS